MKRKIIIELELEDYSALWLALGIAAGWAFKEGEKKLSTNIMEMARKLTEAARKGEGK